MKNGNIMKISSKRRGVIIGISNYSQVSANNNLRFTINDAERFYSLLHSKAGFLEQDLQLLVDAPSDEHKAHAKNPSRANILSAINQAASSAAEDDVLVVFFAGHGVEVGAHPYLLSNDTKMDVVRDTAVDISILNDYLEKSKARCTLRIFDACRSGFSDARLLNPTMSRGLEQALLKSSKGWATFSACSTGECAFEHPDLKQGVFTYYLCEGLQSAAANEDGVVTWERLVDYVKISVSNFCKSQSWVQTPHSVADLSGILELVAIEGGREKPKVGEATPPVPTPKILQTGLRSLLDSHLSEVVGPIRGFRLTKREETVSISELLEVAVTGQVIDFSHPCMEINVSDLRDCYYGWSSEESIKVSMEVRSASNDYTKDGKWLTVEFDSSELSFPSSKLTLAVVRFRFFFWIWFRHECIPNQESVGWNPNPAESVGQFTFSPSVALDVSTIEGAVQQILKTSLQRIADWAAQSKKECADWVQKVSKSNPPIS
jgi:hypothetical protein